MRELEGERVKDRDMSSGEKKQEKAKEKRNMPGRFSRLVFDSSSLLEP